MDVKPLWLLAELTYRCPLQCPYCSNPLEFAGPRFKCELSTEEWCRVFREALGFAKHAAPLLGRELALEARARELERVRTVWALERAPVGQFGEQPQGLNVHRAPVPSPRARPAGCRRRALGRSLRNVARGSPRSRRANEPRRTARGSPLRWGSE